jgi:integrase
LPAMNATPRDRVASPVELERLLTALAPEEALSYALAACATARRQEIRLARWGDVDLDVGVILLGRDEAGRKRAAALRAVPLLRPVRARLREEWLRQGRPGSEQLICPPRKGSSSGLLSMPGVARRARAAWGWEWIDGSWVQKREDALEPIGLHECRHTAASWMNAAGVNPKVASILMGHSRPKICGWLGFVVSIGSAAAGYRRPINAVGDRVRQPSVPRVCPAARPSSRV